MYRKSDFKKTSIYCFELQIHCIIVIVTIITITILAQKCDIYFIHTFSRRSLSSASVALESSLIYYSLCPPC